MEKEDGRNSAKEKSKKHTSKVKPQTGVHALLGGFGAIILFIGAGGAYFFAWYRPMEPSDAQWWAALSVLAALFLGVLGVALVRWRELDSVRSEFESTRNRLADTWKVLYQLENDAQKRIDEFINEHKDDIASQVESQLEKKVEKTASDQLKRLEYLYHELSNDAKRLNENIQKAEEKLQVAEDRLDKAIGRVKAQTRIQSVLFRVQSSWDVPLDGQWNRALREIEDLPKGMSGDELLAISRIAWKMGFIDDAARIRELAYKYNDADEMISIQFAHILTVYPDDGEWLPRGENAFIRNYTDRVEVANTLANGIRKPAKTEKPKDLSNVAAQGQVYAVAQAVTGRCCWHAKEFEAAVAHFTESVKYNIDYWHFRGLVTSLLCSNQLDELREKINEWDPHFGGRDNIVSRFQTTSEESYLWNNCKNRKQEFFRCFTYAWLDESYSGEYYSLFDWSNADILANLGGYHRLSFINVYDQLRKIADTRQIDLYLSYYYFFGDGDIEAQAAIEDAETVRRILRPLPISSFNYEMMGRS